ncbi:hypothetical protein KM043_004440 [Ampulex compressa]|nr:hypothetical protein KM043_004440 [Ampulex compressa]
MTYPEITDVPPRSSWCVEQGRVIDPPATTERQRNMHAELRRSEASARVTAHVSTSTYNWKRDLEVKFNHVELKSKQHSLAWIEDGWERESSVAEQTISAQLG